MIKGIKQSYPTDIVTNLFLFVKKDLGSFLKYTLFYKQHFCKQRQTKIGKKSSKS